MTAFLLKAHASKSFEFRDTSNITNAVSHKDARSSYKHSDETQQATLLTKKTNAHLLGR